MVNKWLISTVSGSSIRPISALHAKLTVTATNGSGYVKRLKGALGAGFELAIGALSSRGREITHRHCLSAIAEI